MDYWCQKRNSQHSKYQMYLEMTAMRLVTIHLIPCIHRVSVYWVLVNLLETGVLMIKSCSWSRYFNFQMCFSLGFFHLFYKICWVSITLFRFWSLKLWLVGNETCTFPLFLKPACNGKMLTLPSCNLL